MFNSATTAIMTLTNIGKITGGSASAVTSHKATGGAGVSNAGTITTLTNSGAIDGGASTGSGNGIGGAGGPTRHDHRAENSGTMTGGPANTFTAEHATGGAGVSIAGTIETLTNSGKIMGGAGAAFGKADGGAAVSNAGKIRALTNSGTIARRTLTTQPADSRGCPTPA